jgi:glycerol transport system ATP-binding protein
MVYQQFINYPSLSVYENIASPLRLAGRSRTEIDETVRRVAGLLKLEPLLDRQPLQLSGGQQQRTALARALAKNARLVLLDEPLANLDYKLREELRAELPKIFAASGAIFVYATAEPEEALLLGGSTATLKEGRITQFGPTVDVYRRPNTLATARTFSDPPINTLPVTKTGAVFRHAGADGSASEIAVPDAYAGIADGDYVLAVRPHHVTHRPLAAEAASLPATVRVTEITGSESFIHITCHGEEWTMLTHGVHPLDPGSSVSVRFEPRHLLVFDRSGDAVAPAGHRRAA